MQKGTMLSSLLYYRTRLAGGRQAVYDCDSRHSYTYDDLNVRANSLAAFLSQKLGLQKGERIGFCSDNHIAFIDAFFASYQNGVMMTTYNAGLGVKMLREFIWRETPRVLFYSPKYRQQVESLRAEYPDCVYIPLDGKPEAGDFCSYEDVVGYCPATPPVYEPPEMADIQMLVHTGGTTGSPKSAMLSFGALYHNILSELLTLDLTSDDCACVALPFYHTAAWNVLTLPLLMLGGRIVLMSRFDPCMLLQMIREQQPTVAMGVETIYMAIAAHPQFAETDFSCFRWMLSLAAPTTRETMEKYWRKNIKLVSAFGMTEAGPNNIVMPAGKMELPELKKRWNCAGKPMFFNNIRIVDENGKDQPDGVPGEMLFSGKLIFSGYWQDEENTRETLRDGWVHTGDIAYRDAEGFYYVCGRKKNMFISGGENVFPIEIELALSEHPAVAYACVIGVPDSKWGEVGKALIVKKQGMDTDKADIQEFVKRECSSIKVPKYIQFVTEIPKNAVGKTDLKTIHERYGYCGD